MFTQTRTASKNVIIMYIWLQWEVHHIYVPSRSKCNHMYEAYMYVTVRSLYLHNESRVGPHRPGGLLDNSTEWFAACDELPVSANYTLLPLSAAPFAVGAYNVCPSLYMSVREACRWCARVHISKIWHSPENIRISPVCNSSSASLTWCLHEWMLY